jgi:hypothetical protein
MPITVTITTAALERVQRKLDRLNTPELITRLGKSLSESLVSVTDFHQPTGATEAGLKCVGEPRQIPHGWRISIGDPRVFGDRNKAAPSKTLEAFFDYLHDIGEEYHITNWWGLSHDHKRLLDEKRRTGQFGGSPGKAFYMWQQNEGNDLAGIKGTRFLERGIEQWRSKVPDIVRSYFAE